MGTWGTSLYANDFASDIRGEYIDKLRRGKTNEEATQELIDNNDDVIGDEEESLFWLALADTQWDYGRLLPAVKEKALYFLIQERGSERWKESGDKQFKDWKATLDKLEEKLISPLSPLKKVSKYRIYQCKWQLGDVFAYKFHSDYSKEKGVLGQYIVFRKISEDIWWPGHVVPAVNVYQWIGSTIPLLDEVKNMELLPQKYWPIAYSKNPNQQKEYLLDLLVNTEKSIPKDHLTFLGNLQGTDLFRYLGKDYYTGYAQVEWKNFEKNILDQYYAWDV